MNKIILHFDMNAYFASVEQQNNPALRGRPVMVCGEGRSVVTTASYEARAYGIKTGMTPYEAKKLCPEIIRVNGDMEKYVDTTRKLRELLTSFTDMVEFFSIDEAFLDVTGSVKSYDEAVVAAKQIKKQIKEKLGLACSVGIAHNKLLAKLASDMQKPDGLVVIRKEEVPLIMEKTPVEKLCGVGRQLGKALNGIGIKTAGELGNAPINVLTKHFGFWGHILQRMGRGEDNNPVAAYYEEDTVKSVGHSYTLPQNTCDLEVIKSYLLMLSEKVGSRMRSYKLRGRTVSLVLRYSDFFTFTRQLALKHYIFTGKEIYGVAYKIFSRSIPLKKPVRLIGVTISSLIADNGQELLLETYRKQEVFTETVDRINNKYGAFTIKPASLIIAERFGILPAPGKFLKNRNL